MNKEELTYPQNGEDLTVTGTAGVDYRQGKISPVNSNRNFLQPYSYRISVTI